MPNVFYAVKKLTKHAHGLGYDVISHFDSEGHFRGSAIFETEKLAKAYMKTFKDKIKAQAKKAEGKPRRPITIPKLKVVETDSIEIF